MSDYVDRKMATGRERRRWDLPTSPDSNRWCWLVTPQPMTGAEWDQMMILLTLYGKALVSPELSVAEALYAIAGPGRAEGGGDGPQKETT